MAGLRLAAAVRAQHQAMPADNRCNATQGALFPGSVCNEPQTTVLPAGVQNCWKSRSRSRVVPLESSRHLAAAGMVRGRENRLTGPGRLL
jgi:hypothetical protein